MDTLAPAAPAVVAEKEKQHPAKNHRKPLRRFLIVTHRWMSLILGLVLLLVTTSGAILLYRGEIVRLIDPATQAAYSPQQGPATTTLDEAFAIVTAAYPAFEPVSVQAENGILRVTDYETSYTVDPSTGKILGAIGESPAWLGFTENMHFCLLACPELPGYIPALGATIPGTAWLFDGEDGTVGGLLLGLFGLMMIYLSITGLWLWMPRPRRWKAAVTVRWRKGRFARDTDLHKIIGMIVLAPVLMWGITGSSYELPFMAPAWYAAVPGSELPAVEAVSKPGTGKDIAIAAAIRSAQSLVPQGTPASVTVPDSGPESATAAYDIWLSVGFDPWENSSGTGNVGVSVDRRSGEAVITYGRPEESLAQTIWEGWNYPVHAGFVVDGWWRILWLLGGLAPVVLAITGLSTWLIRRGNVSRRKKLARQR
ncbi:MAG: PepSY-associated TM helix domain-containing protein [Rhodoglobus sp.]